jgi:hypothetical protein
VTKLTEVESQVRATEGPRQRILRLNERVKDAGQLLQLRVLRLGFFQDGDVGVGVFPEWRRRADGNDITKGARHSCGQVHLLQEGSVARVALQVL